MLVTETESRACGRMRRKPGMVSLCMLQSNASPVKIAFSCASRTMDDQTLPLVFNGSIEV